MLTAPAGRMLGTLWRNAGNLCSSGMRPPSQRRQLFASHPALINLDTSLIPGSACVSAPSYRIFRFFLSLHLLFRPRWCVPVWSFRIQMTGCSEFALTLDRAIN